MKRFLGIVICAALVPALAGAEIHARYRITLQDGRQVVSKDLPVRRGSVVTFHDASSGALTGLPAEDIVSIQTGAVDVRVRPSAVDVLVRGERTVVETPAEPMQPGDVVVLGPTGDGSAQLQNANGAAPPGAVPYVYPPVGAYGGAYPPGTLGNGRPMATPLPAGTASAAGQPPAVGPNGFPVMSGNPPTIGPNGTPISSSDQPIIGPNGTPVLAQPGMAGAAQPVVGPNGTPVLAQPGTPGAAPPVIGPNGTPVLAPAGSPGAAPPNTAPNGTPAAPPPSPH